MTSHPSSHMTRVLVLGDPGIGKTSLARTITKGAFPSAASIQQDPSRPGQEYMTSKQTSIHAGDTTHVINVLDTVEDLAKDAQIDIVYLCFDVSCQATFDAIQTTWLPKAKVLSKKTKSKSLFYILIGLKSDLMRPSGAQCQVHPSCLQPITASIASVLANEINAYVYVEVSALKYLGIEKLKEQTVFCDTNKGLNTTLRRRDKCHVM